MVVGSIIPFAGSTIPEGFLVCNGAAVSRDIYADLFSVIGTTFGAGDGLNTFNLPNLVGRVAMCDSVNYTLGASGGEETHTLTSTELASHSHAVPPHSHGNTIKAKTPKFTHTVTQAEFKYTKLNSGSNFASSKNNAWSSTSTKSMSRATNFAVANHAASNCTMTGGVTDCAAFDTELSGLGAAHNNMMPFTVFTYLIYSPEKVYPPGMVYFNGAMVTGPSGCYFTGKG